MAKNRMCIEECNVSENAGPALEIGDREQFSLPPSSHFRRGHDGVNKSQVEGKVPSSAEEGWPRQ